MTGVHQPWPAHAPQTRLSRNAAMILALIQGGATGMRSRDLRHAMPQPISRREFARAWGELAALGLVVSGRGLR